MTLGGGTDTVVALNPVSGGVRWSFGGSAGLGAVDGVPAVGNGTATTAKVYVAARNGGVFALNADGTEAWHYSTGDTLNVGPAVAGATVGTPATAVEEVLVAGALSTSSIYGVYGAGATGTLISKQAVAGANTSSAPFVLNQNVYYGHATNIAQHSLSAAGVLGADSGAGNLPKASYLEVVTDGTLLYAWRNLANGIVAADTTLTRQWTNAFTPTGAPGIAPDGSIIVALTTGPVRAFAAASPGASSQLFTLNASGHAPLFGWNGSASTEHLYFTADPAQLQAWDATANQLSWMSSANGTTCRAATMDCQGRVFSATSGLTSGKSLVYALVSDDRGLANSAWPSYRIDARNTGNALPSYGVLKSTCTP